MNSSDSRAQIALLADHQIDCVRRLLHVLSREKDALDTRATDAVFELATEKERLAARLDELVGEQRELMSGRDDENIAALSSGGIESATRRDELRELLQACHHQNVVNGSVIELGRRFTEQLLGTIRGTLSHETLYGPKGKPLRFTGTDRFSEA